jgi:hypothetical protein
MNKRLKIKRKNRIHKYLSLEPAAIIPYTPIWQSCVAENGIFNADTSSASQIGVALDSLLGSEFHQDGYSRAWQ